MKRAEKQQQIERMKSELSHIRHAVLLQYKGITVPQDTELRNKIRATGGRYAVLKNRLAARAVAGTPLEKLAAEMTGPSALAWCENEPVGLAKVLTEYVKTIPALQLKAVLLDGATIPITSLQEVASLPSQLELRGRLVGLLASPMRRTVTVLSAPSRGLVTVLQQKSEKSK